MTGHSNPVASATRTPLSCRIALGALLGIALASPIHAESTPAPGLAGRIVPADVLAGLRGGLKVGGLDVDLTARLNTYIDEQLAMASEASLTRLEEIRDTLQLQQSEALASVQDAVADAVTTPDAAESPTGDGSAGSTVPPGSTRISHVITPGRIQLNVLNTADGRSIRHSLEVEVDIHNFYQFNAAARNAIRASRLGRLLQDRR